jgi:hypothetical protein
LARFVHLPTMLGTKWGRCYKADFATAPRGPNASDLAGKTVLGSKMVQCARVRPPLEKSSEADDRLFLNRHGTRADTREGSTSFVQYSRRSYH